ncbi:MAG: hypothetical protein QOF07_2754, partial [Bradyrhizobium sp.]|nr:hypothetical protein [Bradyrhizobium sp.]
MPLDEDLARALSAALADVPSVERGDDVDEVRELEESPFSFNVEADLPELELVDAEPEIALEA